MPNPSGQRDSVHNDPAHMDAKKTQYRDILADLAQLDSNNDASRVQNYNKREVLEMLELIRGSRSSSGIGTSAAGWLNMENMVVAVGAVATGRPSSKARDEAITSLGHLFYLAGAQMTSMVDASLEALLAVLRDPDSTEHRRVLTAKALGEVCWGSIQSQQRLHAQGGVQMLVECVYNYSQLPSLARWACHTLTVLLADNGEIWKYLRHLEALEGTLVALAGEESLWGHWDNNHASILHGLLYGLLPASK